jgi:tetratricopeptide (TPR) repeat protein
VDEAIAQYQKALEIQPRSAALQFNLGTAFDRKGQVDKAIEQYQEAVDLQPDFAQARNNLGDALLRTGRTDGAIAQFQEALKIWPNSTMLRNNLGRAFLLKGQVHEAVAQFQKTLEIQPSFVKARNNLANALLQSGQVNEAMAQFQKTLEIQPNNVDACRYLAWVLATCPEPSIRNGAKAVELAQKANQLMGDGNPVVLSTLAAAYAEAGRFPEAVTTAQKALQLAGSQTNAASVVNALRTQIKCYQAGSPFRDSSLTNTRATTQ